MSIASASANGTPWSGPRQRPSASSASAARASARARSRATAAKQPSGRGERVDPREAGLGERDGGELARAQPRATSAATPAKRSSCRVAHRGSSGPRGRGAEGEGRLGVGREREAADRRERRVGAGRHADAPRSGGARPSSARASRVRAAAGGRAPGERRGRERERAQEPAPRDAARPGRPSVHAVSLARRAPGGRRRAALARRGRPRQDLPRARAAGHRGLRRGDRRRVARRAARGGPAREPVPAPLRRPAPAGRGGAARHRPCGASGSASSSRSRTTSSSSLHLMIAGRLHWKARGAKLPGRVGLAAFDFPSGTLVLTEAGTKRRAALHLVRGEAALAALDRGGLEPLGATRDGVRGGAPAREPHAEAGAHRSRALLRDRERLLRRDPAPRAALAGEAHVARSTRTRSARLHAATQEVLARVGGAAPARGGGRVPGGGDRVPRGDGGARPPPPALPGLRHARAADRPRGERGELLPPLPDRRADPVGSLARPLAQAGLAAHHRGARAEPRAVGRPAPPGPAKEKDG